MGCCDGEAATTFIEFLLPRRQIKHSLFSLSPYIIRFCFRRENGSTITWALGPLVPAVFAIFFVLMLSLRADF